MARLLRRPQRGYEARNAGAACDSKGTASAFGGIHGSTLVFMRIRHLARAGVYAACHAAIWDPSFPKSGPAKLLYLRGPQQSVPSSIGAIGRVPESQCLPPIDPDGPVPLPAASAWRP